MSPNGKQALALVNDQLYLLDVPVTGGDAPTVNVSSPTHVIVDINGYYASGSPTPHTFEWDNPGSGAIAIFGYSFAGSGLNRGVRGEADSTTGGSAGVQGIAGAFNAPTYGVQGISGSGTDAAGVYGVDGSGPAGPTGFSSSGVRGESAAEIGVYGRSNTVAVIGDTRIELNWRVE